MDTQDIYKRIEATQRQLARIDGLLHNVPAGQTHRRGGLLEQRRALLLEQAALSAKRDAGR